VRDSRLWKRLIGVEGAVLERVDLDEVTGAVVARVRLRKAARCCGRCGRRCAGYDRGEGRRRWRALDLVTVQVFVEAEAPRVFCRVDGPTVIAVPWARHGARHTRAFEDTAAWLVTHTSKTAVSELLRVSWRTVGAIVSRVVADGRARHDPFAGLRRIGVDEISYKRGQRYLIVVVDHDTGRLVWAGRDREKATLEAFFDAMGEQGCARITHLSADSAPWIRQVVTKRCPDAIRCADPFHVIKWAIDALDAVRRDAWNTARAGKRVANRRGTQDPVARELKAARWALWKNPEKLTDRQHARLDWVAKNDPKLHRAWLLKEGLRYVFTIKGQDGKEALDRWLSWARRCRIPSFIDVARKITRDREAIDNNLDHGLSNGLIESTNTKIRLLTRMAFGFKSPEALIALALLDRGGYCPPLPGRTSP
jgi:transposase